MIFDRTLLFSNAQAITASASSTDIVDLGATGTVYGAAAALSRDIGKGMDVSILIQVVEAFNTLTSLKIGIETDDNAGFSSAREVLSQTLTLAQLTLGKPSVIVTVPPGTAERYMRIYYTVAGTNPTLGKITAGIVADVQTNSVTF